MKVTYYFILQSNRKGDRQLKIPSPGILLNWINFPVKAQALDPLYLQSSLAKLGNSNQWINVVQNAAVFMWNWHSHIAISIHLFHTCFAAHNFTGIWIGTAKKHRQGRIQQVYFWTLKWMMFFILDKTNGQTRWSWWWWSTNKSIGIALSCEGRMLCVQPMASLRWYMHV